MVFESIIADLLNQVIGDYVENLDAKQLSVGIWAGNLELTDLVIKETALDSLDFPLKLKFGCLDKLVLKIPWTNLYEAPVIAEVEGLYMIIVPNRGVPYNEENAKKLDFKRKQNALERLEQKKKQIRDKADKPKDDTFTEKLIAQIIKNLQVNIKSIHVRYEDKFTDPKQPFSVGATLESLSFETTNADWKANIHDETCKILYKLVHLKNFAVYWDSLSPMFCESLNRDEIRQQLAHSVSQRTNHTYILEPVQLHIKLKLNQRPESDGSNWSIPKVDLSFYLKILAMFLVRQQYKDFLAFLESWNRFILSTPYLKYRPNLNVYRGHYREWWKFAYNAVLERDIRRRKQNWSWKRMREHRELVRNYRRAWIIKLTKSSLPIEFTDLLMKAEQNLDIFNINIAREQAELEIDRRGLTRLEDQQTRGWADWIQSWWYGNQETGNIASRFEKAMNAKEKAKLYQAIDYEENMPLTDYPANFVENRIIAKISLIFMQIEDLLELRFEGITSLFEHSPSSRKFSVKNVVKTLSAISFGDKPMLELLDCKANWCYSDLLHQTVVNVNNVHWKLYPSVTRFYKALLIEFFGSAAESPENSSKYAVLQEYLNYFDPKHFERRDYWWFKEVVSKTIEKIITDTTDAVTLRSETFDFALDKFVVTVYENTNADAIPLILLDSTLKGTAKDWSKQLSVDGSTELQMSYFNEQLQVWEPVIEPLYRTPQVWDRWQLNAKIRSVNKKDKNYNPSMPNMTIDLTASETLNITLTKTFIQLSGRLHKAFLDAFTNRIPSLRNPLRADSTFFRFCNMLPIDIHLTRPFEAAIKPGDEVTIEFSSAHNVEFWVDYNGKHKATFMATTYEEILKIITLEGQNSRINLGIYWRTEYLEKECSVYAPYWMVNSTGKTLTYMAGHNILHTPDYNPVIMPFERNKFQSKNKAYLRVEDSEFSKPFPLNNAGDSGRIVCTNKNGRDYEISIDIQLCQASLTKIVTFASFYSLRNSSKFAIEVREHGSDIWITVPAETCIPFWPTQNNSDRKFMCARYADYEGRSVYFPFSENFEEFCSTGNKYVGFYVICTVTESSCIINIEEFKPGMATALLINDTDLPIQFAQQGASSSHSVILLPRQQVIFTYSNLTKKERAIEWNSGNHHGIVYLMKDNLTKYEPLYDQISYYWVAFFNGRQRTLLFTKDLSVATVAKEAYEMECIEQQVELKLHGIGISLVNNIVSQEILYAGISSSAIIWEHNLRSRFQPFIVKSMDAIESHYQKWLNKGEPSEPVDGGKYVIDFSSMTIRQKNKSCSQQVKIRRSFQDGFYFMYRRSAHQTQIHVKFSEVQIDNHLPACTFPCILAVVPPPRSVIRDARPKAFAEFSFVMNQSEHSDISQIKYLHLLVQEFDVRIDRGLVEAILSMSNTKQISSQYTPDLFLQDMAMAQPRLHEHIKITKAARRKSFYHDLHISPLMIHLSYSRRSFCRGQGPNSQDVASPAGLHLFSIFEVFVKSIGVTLTEVQDVVFKLGYFERKYAFYNRTQLEQEAISHYRRQFIKQLYVFVLGLEILGNPYGLVVDLAGSVQTFFYQPFQGAIQGPDEFVEGLGIGLISLFSSSVGGLSGAAMRITGTVGKGIAALSLDDEFQRRRQEAINRQPKNIAENMARGVQGLGSGLFEGVTGVVTKPIQGARKGGVLGFFGGVGKGLIGVIVRPLTGIVDFASNTCSVIKTFATCSKPYQALRPTRFISSDGIVRPYVLYEAIGYKIFRETNKGKYADKDFFVTHAFINEEKVFIVTDRRTILSSRQWILGTWSASWNYEFEELKRPVLLNKSIQLLLKKPTCSGKGKLVVFRDVETANNVSSKLLQAYNDFSQ